MEALIVIFGFISLMQFIRLLRGWHDRLESKVQNEYRNDPEFYIEPPDHPNCRCNVLLNDWEELTVVPEDPHTQQDMVTPMQGALRGLASKFESNLKSHIN